MLLTNIMNTCYNGVILLKFIFFSNFINFLGFDFFSIYVVNLKCY